MWPWEHLALGYLLYAAGRRTWGIGRRLYGAAPRFRNAGRRTRGRESSPGAVARPADRSGDQSADRSADQPVDRSADQPVDRSADQPVDRSADRSADCSGDRSADRSADQSADRSGDRPAAGPVVALAVATQFPDLVDKPLAWSLGVLPGGLTLGHSLLFAVPVVGAVAAAARRAGAPAYGPAVAVGYLSHLLGDALYPALLGGPPAGGFLLWPLVPSPPGGSGGFLHEFLDLLSGFAVYLRTPAGRAYLLGEAALLGLAALAWVRDGLPGLPARFGR